MEMPGRALFQSRGGLDHRAIMKQAVLAQAGKPRAPSSGCWTVLKMTPRRAATVWTQTRCTQIISCRWLEAWNRNKSNPKQELDLVRASWLPSAWEDTERCGGTPRKRPDHSLVVPRLLKEERETQGRKWLSPLAVHDRLAGHSLFTI